MIALLQPLPIGNAIRCVLAPAAGAEKTRVLRDVADDLTDPTNANLIVYEGDEAGFVDTSALVNGQTYFYRAFDWVNGAWAASASVYATPAGTAEMAYPDPLVIVRERLSAGLKVEVQAGRLKHETGAIPVYTAPPVFENTKWPVVSVHYRNGEPMHRGIGEVIALDVFDDSDSQWTDSEGELTRVQLEIIGWSTNADERNALRVAIKKVLLGNLPIFADAGFSQVEVRQNDVDDMETYNSPVFSTIANLSCLTPMAVTAAWASVTDATVTVEAA